MLLITFHSECSKLSLKFFSLLLPKLKFKKNGIKERIFANFDKINNLIVAKRNGII